MAAQISAKLLVGLDVKGLRAIVTQPAYREQYPNGQIIVELEVVRYERHEGRQWLFVRWDKQKQSLPFSGGYSGWRDDHKGNPVIELL